MTRRSARAFVVLGATALLAGSFGCGDVTSDLITGSSGGSSAGSPMAGAPSGGTATGGASGGAGSSSGGASSGSGGTPECTPETVEQDCTDPERRRCHPTRLVCVECSDEGQCDVNEDCSDDLGECARRCATSDDCIEEDDRVCDTIIGGFCVECVANSDCPSGECALWQCQN